MLRAEAALSGESRNLKKKAECSLRMVEWTWISVSTTRTRTSGARRRALKTIGAEAVAMFAAADLDCSDRIWKLDLLDDCLETIWTMCSDYTTNNSTLKGEWPGAFSSRWLE